MVKMVDTNLMHSSNAFYQKNMIKSLDTNLRKVFNIFYKSTRRHQTLIQLKRPGILGKSIIMPN